MLSPTTAKLGNSFDVEKDIRSKMAEMNLKRASNRESSDTQASLLSTKSKSKSILLVIMFNFDNL